MTRRVRVALVEDHALLADALRVSLGMSGFDVVNVPLTTSEGGRLALLRSVIEAAPRVVLLDLNLGPAGDGTALIQPLTGAGYPVVVLTGSPDRVRWGACLARGATTLVPKAASLQTIVGVIRRVDEGLPVLDKREREALVRLWQESHSHHDERRTSFASLTPREAYVLGQLARGKRVREVAEDAFVSEATVRTQVKSILAKLGVTSQLAAVALARDERWNPPPERSTRPSPGRAGADSTLDGRHRAAPVVPVQRRRRDGLVSHVTAPPPGTNPHTPARTDRDEPISRGEWGTPPDQQA